MIISENMQKITSNKVLENISVIQLSEVLCGLDLMGALKNEPWRSRGSAKHKENMIDALNRLLTEVSDFTTLIWNNATFTEERDLISGMLEVIARH